MIREEEMIRERVKFFKEKNEAIHISIKPRLDGFRKFYNGKTINIKEDYIVFEDEVYGEVLIHLSEILDINKRIEKGARR